MLKYQGRQNAYFLCNIYFAGEFALNLIEQTSKQSFARLHGEIRHKEVQSVLTDIVTYLG